MTVAARRLAHLTGALGLPRFASVVGRTGHALRLALCAGGALVAHLSLLTLRPLGSFRALRTLGPLRTLGLLRTLSPLRLLLAHRSAGPRFSGPGIAFCLTLTYRTLVADTGRLTLGALRPLFAAFPTFGPTLTRVAVEAVAMIETRSIALPRAMH